MPADPPCEVLFELFNSPRGRLSLGRVGLDERAGRIVLLREISVEARAEVRPAVERARHFAHPKLLNVLGVFSCAGRAFIASEYVPGIALCELIALIRAKQRGMAVDVAVRVIRDALRLVGAGRELLRAAGSPPERLLHADSIWIAEFGETLLTEVGISNHLVPVPASALAHAVKPESQDVLTAAIELFHLHSGRLMSGDLSAAARQHLPKSLAEVLEDVFGSNPLEGAVSAAELAQALSDLPTALIANEPRVADELTRFAADQLAERRRRLAALSGSSGSADVEAPTRIYGSQVISSVEGDETTIARSLAPEKIRELQRSQREQSRARRVEELESLFRNRAQRAARSTPPAATKPAQRARTSTAPSLPLRPKRASKARAWGTAMLLIALIAGVAWVLVQPERFFMLVQRARTYF